MTELQIVGEAWDRLDAIKKAEELQPDLILLDIWASKPGRHRGARQIRKLSPESKIVFVSQEPGTLFRIGRSNGGFSVPRRKS
jgi:DNA-binding NarL/FixJ family response regulator